MKRSYRQRMLARYPGWHDQPFSLTLSEIEDPYQVLEEFFTRYNLDNLRIQLKELLTGALCSEMHDDPSMYVNICENLEKLSEACYVLYRKEAERSDFINADALPQPPLEEKEGSLPPDMEDGDEDWAISRPALLLEIASYDPLKAINRTFQMIDLKNLHQCMEDWLHIALCNEQGGYDHGALRSRLITYVKAVQRLFEALFVLRETWKIKHYTGADYLSPGLQSDIRKLPHIQLLPLDELLHPMEVIIAFYKQFSYRYARLELWDLLDAVICYDGDDPKPVNRMNLLVDYDCMAALLLSAKLLSMQPEGTPSHQNTNNEGHSRL